MKSNIIADVRDRPDDSFIQSIRNRFPVEAEIDKILTDKLKNRLEDNTPYTPVSLQELCDGMRKLLEVRVFGSCVLKNPRWLSGGASMIQMAFELCWRGPDGLWEEEVITKMVLRMSPKEPVCVTSFLRESEIVNILKEDSDIPVPRCFWIDDKAEFLPYPSIVYELMPGIAKPQNVPSEKVTGVGLNFGPELRCKLAPKFVKHIAKLHNFDILRYSPKGFDKIELGKNDHVIKQINWWHRVWEEDRGEDEPIIQLAAKWLRKNAPVLNEISILHNDLRSGNFLFDEQSAEITAWLDWELVSMGDRHQDLGWMMAYQFGHYAEDDETYLVSGLLPREEMISAYERESGQSIDRARLRYYDIFNSWRACIIVMGPGYRIAKGGKTHQDVVVTWLSTIGYHILENLRKALEGEN